MSGAKGFTALELLIVVLMVGLLAAIATPRFLLSMNSKAYDAAAMRDLRNAMTAQELYAVNTQIYTSVANLEMPRTTDVSVGGGGTAAGYDMTAKHSKSTNTFRVIVGTGTSTDGQIQCVSEGQLKSGDGSDATPGACP